jgi:hypothetical protein
VAAVIVLMCVPVRFSAGGSEFGLADLASLVLVAVALVTAPRRGRPLNPAGAWLFGAVILAGSLCALAGYDTATSFVGWVRYLQLFALVPLAVMLCLRSVADAWLVAHATIAAAMIEGAVGVFQYLTRTGASYGGAPMRAVGTFGADDVIAMSVVVSLGLVLAVGLAQSSSGRARFGYAAVAAGLLVPLGLSLSRGSWIATVVAVFVVLLLAGPKVLLVAGLTAVALVTVLVGGFGVGSAVLGERLSSITSSAGAPDSSVNDRYDLWTAAVGMWSDHPVFGVGIKAFPRFRDSYAPLSLNSSSDVGQGGSEIHHEELLSPHNQYLLVLAEQGAVGTVALLALLIGTTGAAARSVLRAPSAQRGLGLGLTGLAVWQLVQFAYGDLGGASSLVTSLNIGLAAWWGLEQRPRPATGAPRW